MRIQKSENPLTWKIYPADFIYYATRILEKASPDDGYLCIRSGNGTDQGQSFFPVSQLQNENAVNQELSRHSYKDAYMSFASYKGGKHPRRSEDRLLNIYAFSIDVDYPNLSVSPEDILSYILENVSIPVPNYAECGHRLRLIYIFREPLRLFSKQKKALLAGFHFLQESICQMINETLSFDGISFGAESNPPTSFFRIPGSINTKDDSVIRLLFISKEQYTLQEYFEEWIPSVILDKSGCKEKWYAEWKQTPKKRKSHSSIQKLWEMRLQTLKELRTLQNPHRKKLLFVYACGLKHLNPDITSQELFQECLLYNEGFSVPLRPNQVYAQINQVNKKNYKFTDEFLAFYLEVDSSYFAALSRKERDKVRYEEKKKQKQKKGQTRQQKVSRRQKKIKEMITEGYTLIQIAKECRISIATVKRDIQKLKKTAAIIPAITVKQLRKVIRKIRKNIQRRKRFQRNITKKRTRNNIRIIPEFNFRPRESIKKIRVSLQQSCQPETITGLIMTEGSPG